MMVTKTEWADIQLIAPMASSHHTMPAHNRDLFDDLVSSSPAASPTIYLAAFEAWSDSRQHRGELREHSSIAVYRSMWGALTAWCGGRGLPMVSLDAVHLEAYLHSRGGAEDLTPRHAWRLLMLVDAVLAHHADSRDLPRNPAAHALLMARPDWRYANASDKTPLPEHLSPEEARQLVAWLLDPSADIATAGAPAKSWQLLRNRTAVGLQLGAGLTPGDIRLATVAGVISAGTPSPTQFPDLPWKIRVPAHGGSPAREAPIARWAGRLLQAWLNTRQALQFPGEMLFPAATSGRAWGKVAQYTAAKAVLVAAGLDDAEGGSFKLRHTFALRQLQRGSSADQVAQWMGLRDSAALARHRRLVISPVDVV
jgi:integrase